MGSITKQYFPALAGELQRNQKVGILVSGGADSEILLRAAADVLGASSVTAFNAVTPFLANYYTDLIQKLTSELGVKLVKVPLNLMDIEEIRENTQERCYHCKKAIYFSIKAAALEWNITTLADGTNTDDLSEYRPGLKAAKEQGIVQPFLRAEMTRSDIEKLGRALGMTDTQRPPDSCLATRIDEDTPITTELLSLVNKIEQPLRASAKGRLRAKVSPSHVTVEYQAVDKLLVEANKRELTNIAEVNKLSIAFHENT